MQAMSRLELCVTQYVVTIDTIVDEPGLSCVTQYLGTTNRTN